MSDEEPVVGESPDVEENRITIQLTWRADAPEDLLTRVGEWLERRWEHTAAMGYFQAALTVNPACTLACYRAGDLALRRQEYELALQMFERSLAVSPGVTDAYKASLAAAALHRHETALALTGEALQHNPKHTGATLQRLRSLAALERWSEVITEFEGSQADRPSMSEGYLWVALAHVRLGRPAEAANAFQHANRRVRRENPETTREVEVALSRE